ncbi:hypothetical protein DFQ27_009813 [Actinomortierella ambigua]|uniref:Autophagy-related protein 27 n=1 Tax=Actinomortierella ambigua TaxID=1343610 RepID=A0A9P6TWJ8_9FUNG|nr:hypothetical protein DFQ27_009813 [Actinomortierella ambigua]
MLRPSALLATTLLLLSSIAHAQADDYKCSDIKIGNNHYDISALDKTFSIKGTPYSERPSSLRDDYLLNPCKAIAVEDDKKGENCEPGTWVCQSVKLLDGDSEKILYLRPLAGEAPASGDTPARTVSPTAALAAKPENAKEDPWTLTLKGGLASNKTQSTVIKFVCSDKTEDTLKFESFTEGDAGVTSFTWESSHACAKQQVPNPPTEGMSGFGVFFTILFVFGAIYLVVGAVYNHQVYGAKGLDLLPNLEFWRDFPGLVKDVFFHVWDSVTGRSSNRGYMSV